MYTVHVAESRDISIEPDVDRAHHLSANNDDSVIAASKPEVKRYMAFRSDLGKRGPFRSDLGKKRGYDVSKRFSAFRSDLGKRRSQTSSDDAESLAGFKHSDLLRCLFGKHDVRGYDIDNEDDDVAFDVKKKYTSFRSDLGKRRMNDETSSDDTKLVTDNDDRRFSSFRSCVSQLHRMPLTGQKIRSDFGKRPAAFRSDLGK